MAAGQYLALPSVAAGVSVVSTATAWVYGSWVIASSNLPTLIVVYGLAFEIISAQILTLDVTQEMLFDIGVGAPGAEVTKIQIPYSVRQDTAVGYYFRASAFLPEPVIIDGGNAVSVRVTDSRGVAGLTYHATIMYLERYPPLGKIVKAAQAVNRAGTF